MKPRDMLLEARSIINEVPSRITERVLKQSSDLKPEYISLISKVRELYSTVSTLIDSLLNSIKEDVDTNSIVSIGRNMYIAFHANGFYIVRSKPFYIILSYRRDLSELCIKTKNMNTTLTPSRIDALLLSIKTSIELNKIESYVNNYRELKYIINYISRVLEKYLVAVMETRLKITK